MSNYSFEVYLVSLLTVHGNDSNYANRFERTPVAVCRRHKDAVEYIKGSASAYGYKLKEDGPANFYEVIGSREFVNEYDEDISKGIRCSANYEIYDCESAGWEITEINLYSDKCFKEEES